MSFFAENLANHLAKELNVEVENVIKAMNTFSCSTSSVISKQSLIETQQQCVDVSPSTCKSVASEKYPCCRVKRGKTDPCGNSAAKNIDGKWYCGGIKSGCYSIMLKKKAEKSTPVTVNNTISKTNSATTNSERKDVSTNKSVRLINKFIKKDEITTVSVTNDEGYLLYYDIEHRILFDKNSLEAYGVLSEDNNTITPLEDFHIKWLEANNCSIRAKDESQDLDDDDLDDDDLDDDDNLDDEF